MCCDICKIVEKLEDKFKIEFNIEDTDIISIHNSEFDYDMVEFVEDEFKLCVDWRYVADDFVEMEFSEEDEADKVYKNMKKLLYSSALCDIDKLYVCNKLVTNVLGE